METVRKKQFKGHYVQVWNASDVTSQDILRETLQKPTAMEVKAPTEDMVVDIAVVVDISDVVTEEEEAGQVRSAGRGQVHGAQQVEMQGDDTYMDVFFRAETGRSNRPKSWLIDSGASRHMTNNRDCLSN